MKLRISSYNVESLFNRAIALGKSIPSDERQTVLEQQARINEVFAQPVYDAATKNEILDLLTSLGVASDDSAGKYVILRQDRGRLVTRHPAGVEVTANGRSDWIGWVELKTEPVNEVATQSTAHVIKDVAADIQAVVEAESRPSLKAFSDTLLPQVGDGHPFDHVMLVDGNDDRGIDVGIMCRNGWEIVAMRSHVDDRDDTGVVFSRDCIEHTLGHPNGGRIVAMVNHFKSKGYGSQAANDAKRLRQATRAAGIYRALRDNDEANVVVLGDFNDSPGSSPLQPLLDGTDLRDISDHPKWVSDGRVGTFGNGAPSEKIDFILLSPALFDKVVGGQVFRLGVWGGAHGTLFPHYPEITKAAEAASDHAAIYADLEL